MIIIGLGSNLAAPGFRSPRETVRSALAALPEQGIEIVACSPFYLSEPVPRSDQPWFVNAVARIATRLAPEASLARMLALERHFGRVRGVRNAARTLDLDLLDYDGRILATADLVLPHPRLHQRRFVLAPLADLAPDWRHPVSGLGAAELLALLPPDQGLRRLDEQEDASGMRDGDEGGCGHDD